MLANFRRLREGRTAKPKELGLELGQGEYQGSMAEEMDSHKPQ